MLSSFLSKVPLEVLQNWVLIQLIVTPHIMGKVQGQIKEVCRLIEPCLLIGTREYMGLQQIYQPCALKFAVFFSFHFYCTFGILPKQKTLAFSRALLELLNHYFPPKNDFDDIWNGISSLGNYVNWRCILKLARHHIQKRSRSTKGFKEFPIFSFNLMPFQTTTDNITEQPILLSG